MRYKNEFLGELIGTFLLVLFGCGSNAAIVLFNAHQGLFQLAMICGFDGSMLTSLSENKCRMKGYQK